MRCLREQEWLSRDLYCSPTTGIIRKAYRMSLNQNQSNHKDQSKERKNIIGANENAKQKKVSWLKRGKTQVTKFCI